MESYEHNLTNRIKKGGNFTWETNLFRVTLEVKGKTWSICALPTINNNANVLVDTSNEVEDVDIAVDEFISRFALDKESEIVGKLTATKTPSTIKMPEPKVAPGPQTMTENQGTPEVKR